MFEVNYCGVQVRVGDRVSMILEVINWELVCGWGNIYVQQKCIYMPVCVILYFWYYISFIVMAMVIDMFI